MKGIVDDAGRAILPVEILCTKHPTGVQVDVWIDTGFTGDLVLPKSLVEDLELEVTGSIDGVLADGSQVELSTYHRFPIATRRTTASARVGRITLPVTLSFSRRFFYGHHHSLQRNA